MKENKGMTRISTREVNLKSFLRKVYQYKKLFLICLGSAIALAFLYISLATPKYEVATSILIDSSGSNRMLGESQYVQGGVGLIEVEKNLFNEIGIIKSFSLINQTVEDLNLDVTYYSGDWITPKEQYGYYPFTVKIDRTKPQLYNEPFEVQILSDTKYRLSLITDDFEVSNPANGTVREVSRRLEVKDIFEFGEEITHEYFTFSIGKSDEFKSASIAVGSELSFKVHPSADITLAFMSDLEVNNIDLQASIFQIVSYGPIVEKEVDFLGQLTHNYLQNKLDARNKIALSKAAFIRDQLDVITDSLTQSELELESFKKEFDAIDLGATATKAMNVTQNLQVNQAKLQLDIQYYNSVIKYIENNRNSEQFIIPSSSGITVPLINDNIIELKNLYAERSRKKFYVTSNNEEINILNQQIRESSQRLLSNLRNAVQAARRQLGGVSSQLASFDGVINSLPTREKQLLSIQRERTLYENLFNYLSEELAKTGIARAERTSDTQVLDEPRMMGTGPVAPQKKLIGILALAVGMLIPMTWLVWFSPEDMIENEEQIRAITNIPIIASVVHNSIKGQTESTLWQVKESFRDMSANLRFVCAKNNCVIGMTSIMPEEGKTYCAINLGITFAEAGKKTLIIDADLRQPSLVKGIKKIEGRSLVDYLKGDIINVGDIIYTHDQLEHLQFIPTAVADGNIQELLSGEYLALLVSELKERYDYIIFDTPAVGLVSDILLMWDLIDINLFVMRRQIAKVGFIKDLENLNQKGKKKKSYIIFNNALKKDFKYGYGLQYGINQEKQLVKDSLSV